MPHARPDNPAGSWRRPGSRQHARPLVAITTDITQVNSSDRFLAGVAYAHAVARAGGVPTLLPAIPDLATDFAARFEAFVFTGGDDPRTEPYGRPTDERVTPLHPDRQAFESALIRTLASDHPDKPVLGICLGMQMLALESGGVLDQYMPDTIPDAERFWGHDQTIRPVEIDGAQRAPTIEIPEGLVHCRHKQAIRDAGSMRVLARAEHDVIEAIDDPKRRFCVGVQWHAERTETHALGQAIFDALIRATGYMS